MKNQKNLSPMAAMLLVNEMNLAGHSREVKDFPLVAEVGNELVFIINNENAYFVSSWSIKETKVRCRPYHVSESFEQSVLAFNNYYSELIEQNYL